MTTQPILTDDLLRDMLKRRADRARPEGVLAEIVRDLEGVPQRARPWVGPLLRWPALPQVRVLQAAGLAVVLVVVASLALRPQIGPGKTPGPSPSPTSTASVSLLQDGGVALSPDRYRTRNFEPALELTVAEPRWDSIVDLRRLVWLHARFEGAPAEEINDLSLVAITNLYADSCTQDFARRESWPSTSGPTEFLDGIESNMGVDLGPRTPIAIAGGSGLQVEFVVPALPNCSTVIVPISDVGFELGWQEPFAMSPSGTVVRWAVVRVSERTLLVETRTSNPARHDPLWVAADGIVGSLTPAR